MRARLGELRADVDAWLVVYNEQRMHQGPWCYAIPLDHFMLYKNKKKTDRFGPVVLTDQFQQAYYTVRDAIQLGLPADKNAEGMNDANTHSWPTG